MKSPTAWAGVGVAVIIASFALTPASAQPVGPYAPEQKIVAESVTLQAFEVRTVRATCPDGKSLTGGGFSSDTPPNVTNLLVPGSYPDPDGRTWIVVAADSGPTAVQVKSYAVCTRS
jgi:hypothetical protein